MKINFNTNASTTYLSKANNIMAKQRGEHAFERHNLTQDNNDKINTTIKSNSDGRVSFKGAPFLHSLGKFANDNPLVAEALFALVITCGARPATIMATAKTPEDKEKCTYQAVKSISSGIVGLVMTALVGIPIAAATKLAQNNGAFSMPTNLKQQAKEVVSNGVSALSDLSTKLIQEGKEPELVNQIKELIQGNKLNINVLQNGKKRASKIFQNKISEIAPEISTQVKESIQAQTQINNYARTGKNIMDKLFQPIFMPLRATITIALVPTILSLLGQKKPGTKSTQQPQNTQLAGGVKNENK